MTPGQTTRGSMGKGLYPLLPLLINNLRLLSYTRAHYHHRRLAAEDHVASTGQAAGGGRGPLQAELDRVAAGVHRRTVGDRDRVPRTSADANHTHPGIMRQRSFHITGDLWMKGPPI